MQIPPHASSSDPKPLPADNQSVRTASDWAVKFGWSSFALLLIVVLIATGARAELRPRLLPALVITLIFAILARILRGVTLSGALAGFMVTFILFIARGVAMFGAVLLVFILTFIATRFGRKRKRSLAIAERASGRDAAQVLANVGCAAIAAAAAILMPWHSSMLAGSIAALAEAASDTVSSETGKAVAITARLITSGQTVPAGTDGAISLMGTLAGIAAAGFVALEAIATRMLDFRLAITACLAGILGMFLDSILGATLEPRRLLTNNAVNLVSTALAALAGILLAQFG